jgi:hypothetical protein
MLPPPLPTGPKAVSDAGKAHPADVSRTLNSVDAWMKGIPVPGQDAPLETNRVFTSHYPAPAASGMTRTVITPSHGRESIPWR